MDKKGVLKCIQQFMEPLVRSILLSNSFLKRSVPLILVVFPGDCNKKCKKETELRQFPKQI